MGRVLRSERTIKTALAFVAILSTVSTLYMLMNRKIVVNMSGVTDRHMVSRPLATVTVPCSEYFIQSHFMTIDSSEGRIGNNLFRLLALIGTAKRNCYTPLLDKRKFTLLNRMLDLSFLADLPRTHFHWHVMETVPCCIYPTEMDSLNTTFNWTLKGFMQSWRYMQGHEEYIRSVIKFRPDMMLNASDYIEGLRRRNDYRKNNVIVCVHIRRGDFLNYTDLGYITSGVTYLNNSMAYYNNKFGQNIPFVILSNDMTWVNANIKGRHVYYSEGRTAAVDMAIMSLCNHSIITAGSFGYLGAWLNGGSVVYDSKFPKPGSQLAKQFNMTDYYPRSWLPM